MRETHTGCESARGQLDGHHRGQLAATAATLEPLAASQQRDNRHHRVQRNENRRHWQHWSADSGDDNRNSTPAGWLESLDSLDSLAAVVVAVEESMMMPTPMACSRESMPLDGPSPGPYCHGLLSTSAVTAGELADEKHQPHFVQADAVGCGYE